MSDVVGSLRKVTIDGITFRVTSEGGYSGPGSEYENSSISTSGGNMRKMVKRPTPKEGITIICNGSERDELQDIADSRNDVPLAVENAAGDVYRTTGWIEFEGFESEEGKATVQMHPRDTWTSFLKS